MGSCTVGFVEASGHAHSGVKARVALDNDLESHDSEGAIFAADVEIAIVLEILVGVLIRAVVEDDGDFGDRAARALTLGEAVGAAVVLGGGVACGAVVKGPVAGEAEKLGVPTRDVSVLVGEERDGLF